VVDESLLDVKFVSTTGDMGRLSYSSKRRSSYSAAKGSSISSGGRAAEGRRAGEPITSISLNKSSKSLDSTMSFSNSSSPELMEVDLAAEATGAADLNRELVADAFLADVLERKRLLVLPVPLPRCSEEAT